MSKVYNGQTQLRIQLTTGVDIAGATVKRIKYKKPSDATGYWDATVSDESTGVIYYDVTSGDIDETGYWKLWAYVTFSDGRSAPGEAITEYFYTEGD